MRDLIAKIYKFKYLYLLYDLTYVYANIKCEKLNR